MTQHGCRYSSFKLTAHRSGGSIKSSSTGDSTTVTVTKNPSSTLTSSQSTSANTAARPSIEIIVGYTVGACTFFSIIALLLFLVHRRRRFVKESKIQAAAKSTHSDSYYHTQDLMTLYNPLVSPSGWSEADDKAWQQWSTIGMNPAKTFAPMCSGVMEDRSGVMEMDGTNTRAEAPG